MTTSIARAYLAKLTPAVALLALSLAHVPTAQAEAQVAADGQSASASINFRVIIPSVMRLLENSHPQQLTVASDGSSAGQQRLVVMSNMKRGICITLSRPAGMDGQWDLRQLDNSPVYMQRVAQGYKLCTTRAGRYTLELEHSFKPASTVDRFASLPWPVQTDVNAI